MNFHWRTQHEALETHHDWLVDEMRQILQELQPEGWEEFKFSEGWLGAFKTRYRISSLVRTNKKEVPVSQRVPVIRFFHREMDAVRNSNPQRCHKYGRFRAHEYFHMVSALEFAALVCL